MIFANLDTCSTRGTPIYLLFLQNHHIESISFPNYSFRQLHYSQLSMQNSKLSQNSWIWILPLSPLFCSHRKPIPSGRWYICICARFSLFWKKTFAPCLPQRANREYPLVIILSLFRDTLIPPRSRKRFLYIDDKKTPAQSASSLPYRQCAIFFLAGTKAKTLRKSARSPYRRGTGTRFRIRPIKKLLL